MNMTKNHHGESLHFQSLNNNCLGYKPALPLLSNIMMCVNGILPKYAILMIELQSIVSTCVRVLLWVDIRMSLFHARKSHQMFEDAVL